MEYQIDKIRMSIPKEGYQLFDGRPKDIALSDVEIKVYDFLDNLNISYKTLTHPAAFTIEECQKVRDIVQVPVFKNLFLTNRQQTRFYLLLIPGEKIFKTKYLSSQINAPRLSFATEDQMSRIMDVHPGSVTPMGLINDRDKEVNILLDEDLREYPLFACHPCINTSSVVMRLEDLVNKFIPATGHDIKWVNLPWE